MTNALYPKARESFLTAVIPWTSSDIRCCLVRDYTYDALHNFRDDVTGAGGSIVASSATFTAKSATNGTADAGDVTFAAVAAGADITSLILYVEGASDSARRLIAYIDDGFPITPDGSDITIQWSSGTDKIFTL
jgi:hypothetical protein